MRNGGTERLGNLPEVTQQVKYTDSPKPSFSTCAHHTLEHLPPKPPSTALDTSSCWCLFSDFSGSVAKTLPKGETTQSRGLGEWTPSLTGCLSLGTRKGEVQHHLKPRPRWRGRTSVLTLSLGWAGRERAAHHTPRPARAANSRHCSTAREASSQLPSTCLGKLGGTPGGQWCIPEPNQHSLIPQTSGLGKLAVW